MTSFPQCAKCGACTAVCPVYQTTGRESHTARGRLHLLANADQNDPQLADIFSKCLLCGACRSTCPRGIDIPALIIEARSAQPEITGFSTFKKFLARQALAHPTILSTLAKTAGPLGLLPTLPEDSGLRLTLANQPHDIAPLDGDTAISLAKPFSGAKTALYFSGCLTKHLAPAIGLAAEVLLAQVCKHRLLVPDRQSCCGLAAKSSGDMPQAQNLARRTITLFSEDKTRDLPILTTCASCYAGLKAYPAILASDHRWRDRALHFSERVWEFSSFLLEHRLAQASCFKSSAHPTPVVYHDPCHLRFAGITSPPRQLIRETPGLRLLELPHGSQCCGMGGLFHLSHGDLSAEIRQRLIDDFLTTGSELVTSTCSGCLIQWQRGLAAAQSSARATHLAILLAQQLKERNQSEPK